MRTPLLLTFSLLTTGLTAAGVSADAGLRPITGNYANLVNQGKCVDTQGSRTTNGTPLILWDCNGSKTQQWTYNERTLSLQNRASGTCVDVEDRDDNQKEGATLILWNCEVRNKSQQWEHQGYRGSDNLRGIGGNCMATENRDNKNGTYLILATCNNRAYQQFWGQELRTAPTSSKVASRAEVCLYELAEYKGWKKCVSTDQPNFVELDINDSVSSLTVHGNLKIKLYTDVNYQGTERIYTQDVPWVGDAVNNKFSSLKIDKTGIAKSDSYPHREETSQQNRYDEIADAIRRREEDAKPIGTRVKTNTVNRDAKEFFTLVSRGKCLDAHKSDFDARLNGSRVQIWECHNQANQNWKMDDFGHILSRNGKCLGITTNQVQNGTKVQLWDCRNQATQQWTLDNGRLFHAASNKCLDLDFDTMNQNGGKVQLWDCHGRMNQQWTVTYPPVTSEIPGNTRQLPPSSKYPTQTLQEFFRFSGSGRCLDIHRLDFDTRRNGGKVQTWECNNEVNQDWKFDIQGRLLTKNSKCLDLAPDGGSQNGTLVQTWDCSNKLTQQWDLDNGRLRNRAANKCLDLDSDTRNRNGGKLQIWECHDRSNQQWSIMYH